MNAHVLYADVAVQHANVAAPHLQVDYARCVMDDLRNALAHAHAAVVHSARLTDVSVRDVGYNCHAEAQFAIISAYAYAQRAAARAADHLDMNDDDASAAYYGCCAAKRDLERLISRVHATKELADACHTLAQAAEWLAEVRS